MQPQYTIADLVYWSGFIAGCILGFFTGHAFFPEYMTHPIVRIAVPIVTGVGVGFVCERIYQYLRTRPPRG